MVRDATLEALPDGPRFSTSRSAVGEDEAAVVERKSESLESSAVMSLVTVATAISPAAIFCSRGGVPSHLPYRLLQCIYLAIHVPPVVTGEIEPFQVHFPAESVPGEHTSAPRAHRTLTALTK